jgi:hypothetical protein
MDIIYINDAIVDVKVGNDLLQTKMTVDERVTIFGCDTPNPTVLDYLGSLERGVPLDGEDSPKTAFDVVDAIVAYGGMTAERAAEIKAG